MIRSAKEVILVADASKFGQVAFAGVAPLSVLHQVVTDQPPPPDLAETFARLGVVVHVAGQEDNEVFEAPLEDKNDS
jgi:DeoR/GlpR family transcriptional regulator of sugar metabolism